MDRVCGGRRTPLRMTTLHICLCLACSLSVVSGRLLGDTSRCMYVPKGGAECGGLVGPLKVPWPVSLDAGLPLFPLCVVSGRFLGVLAAARPCPTGVTSAVAWLTPLEPWLVSLESEVGLVPP